MFSTLMSNIDTSIIILNTQRVLSGLFVVKEVFMFSTGSSIDYSQSSNKNLSIDYRKSDDVYNSMSEKNKMRSDNVNRIADKLVSIFHAPDSKPFFQKCAWNLSEYEITRLVGLAQKPRVKNQLYYFISLANRQF